MKKIVRTKPQANRENNFARKAARTAAADLCRCNFVTSDGRQCRMPRWQEGHRAFCRSHSRREDEMLAPNKSTQELLSFSGEFKTFSEVNHVLGKLWEQFVKGKIPRGDAATLAYIGQLLLQSLPSVRNEIKTASGYSAWEQTLREVLNTPRATSHHKQKKELTATPARSRQSTESESSESDTSESIEEDTGSIEESPASQETLVEEAAMPSTLTLESRGAQPLRWNPASQSFYNEQLRKSHP